MRGQCLALVFLSARLGRRGQSKNVASAQDGVLGPDGGALVDQALDSHVD